MDKNDQTITQALEPLISDRITQPWSYYEMQLILQAESDVLSENDINKYQKIIESVVNESRLKVQSSGKYGHKSGDKM